MEELSLDWENCFGIKKIKQDFSFENSNIQLIYAPNGVMKTSFAKTMRYLEFGNNEDLPRDRLKNLKGKYSTRVDGADIAKEIIYVINGETDIDSSNSFSKKNFVEKHKNQLNEYISRYEELLSKSDFFCKKIIITSAHIRLHNYIKALKTGISLV